MVHAPTQWPVSSMLRAVCHRDPGRQPGDPGPGGTGSGLLGDRGWRRPDARLGVCFRSLRSSAPACRVRLPGCGRRAGTSDGGESVPPSGRAAGRRDGAPPGPRPWYDRDQDAPGGRRSVRLRSRSTPRFPSTGEGAEKNDQGGCAPSEPPEGKEVTIQGVSVRATRNPTRPSRLPVVYVTRSAARRNLESLTQEPPRITRREQFPPSHALPSTGAPA